MRRLGFFPSRVTVLLVPFAILVEHHRLEKDWLAFSELVIYSKKDSGDGQAFTHFGKRYGSVVRSKPLRPRYHVLANYWLMPIKDESAHDNPILPINIFDKKIMSLV